MQELQIGIQLKYPCEFFPLISISATIPLNTITQDFTGGSSKFLLSGQGIPLNMQLTLRRLQPV